MKQNVLYYAQKNKLAAALIIIFIVSAFILLLRKPISIDVLDGGVSFVEESVISTKLSYQDNELEYSAEPIEGETLDFDYQKNAAYKDLGNIPFGMYYLHVDYSTSYDTTYANEPITELYFTGLNSDKFVMTTCSLQDYKKWVEVPLWIKSVQGSDDMRLNFNFSNYGETNIKTIKLVESKLWKFGFLLAEAFIFALICFINYKFKKSNPEDRVWLLAFILMVIFASFPAFIGGSRAYLVVGHDYYFHTTRIASIANEIRYGHFPALYQSDAMNGYGYVALLMYGSIFLYIPAILHVIGFTLPTCYNIYIVLTNVVTIAIAMYSFKIIFKEKKYAVLGTFVYTLAAYRLGNVYIRSAVGEYTAMAFLPLVIAGLYKIYFEKEKAKFKDCIPLILGISGIIECHVLSVEMLAWFILAFAIIFFRRTITNILVLIESVVSVLVLNAFFIVPFWDTMKQGLAVSAAETSSNLQPTGVILPQLFSVFVTSSGVTVDYETIGEMPLSLGLTLVVGLFLFIIVCAYKDSWNMTDREKESFNIVKVLFAFALVSMVLSTSYFPWKELADSKNKIIILITSVQFAWRYLMLASLFLTVITVYSTMILEKYELSGILKKATGKIYLVLVLSTFIVAGYFFTGFINEAETEKNYSSTTDTMADDLYVPVGMNFYAQYDTSVIVDPDSSAQVKLVKTDKNNNKIFRVSSVNQDCTVSFPVTYYDYLVVIDVRTGEKLNTFRGYNQRLAISLNQGYSGDLKITYEIRNKWKLAFLISGVSAVLLGLYCGLNGRKAKV